jgi:uncharacterized protein with GYD domain
MVRYVVLLNFTDKGITNIKESPGRADAFRAAASKVGAKVECQYWTIGCYDGAFVLSAPDDATASALVLGLGKGDNVRTTMLRALDETEFKTVVSKLS